MEEQQLSLFVILTHDHPILHWDFMLEQGEGLRTWRLLSTPDGAGTIQAEALPDHRKLYLEYEGPVSGDRGVVSRWDWGHYTLVNQTETRVEVALQGQRLAGVARLSRRQSSRHWTFYLKSD